MPLLSDSSQIPSPLRTWLQEVITLCKPAQLWLCDGSQEEYAVLCKKMEQTGTAVPLNPHKRPNSFLCCSTPDDVARVEESTFICSYSSEEAGPTNHWKDPTEMRRLLTE